MGRTHRARRWSRRLWGAVLLGAGLCSGFSGAVAAAAIADPCTPWPGEPRPLPSVADTDPLRALWAGLRVRELSARAQRLETASPLEANQLWQRALCLEPTSAEARAGAARTRPIRVYRPDVSVVRQPVDQSVDQTVDQTAGRHAGQQRAEAEGTRLLAKLLSAPIPVYVAARPRPKPPDEALADAQRRLIERVEKLLVETESRLRRARFEEALASADEARSRLALVTSQGERRAREARLEVLTATAQLALGEEGAARESLGRAILANPTLELDPMKTSPKVIRALAAVRAQREARP